MVCNNAKQYKYLGWCSLKLIVETITILAIVGIISMNMMVATGDANLEFLQAMNTCGVTTEYVEVEGGDGEMFYKLSKDVADMGKNSTTIVDGEAVREMWDQDVTQERFNGIVDQYMNIVGIEGEGGKIGAKCDDTNFYIDQLVKEVEKTHEDEGNMADVFTHLSTAACVTTTISAGIGYMLNKEIKNFNNESSEAPTIWDATDAKEGNGHNCDRGRAGESVDQIFGDITKKATKKRNLWCITMFGLNMFIVICSIAAMTACLVFYWGGLYGFDSKDTIFLVLGANFVIFTLTYGFHSISWYNKWTVERAKPDEVKRDVKDIIRADNRARGIVTADSASTEKTGATQMKPPVEERFAACQDWGDRKAKKHYRMGVRKQGGQVPTGSSSDSRGQGPIKVRNSKFPFSSWQRTKTSADVEINRRRLLDQPISRLMNECSKSTQRQCHA